MIPCVITVPQEVIRGAFNILFSFPQEVYMVRDDFRIETVSGDPLGDPRDCLKGEGKHWMCQCYVPTGIAGKSLVYLDMRGFASELIEIQYDTDPSVEATWFKPVVNGDKIEISLFFNYPLRHLHKRNFKFSQPTPFQLYRDGILYKIVFYKKIEGRLSVKVGGAVVKQNGVKSVIEDSVLEV